MRTLELIAQQVIGADPLLRSTALLKHLPAALVVRRKAGCVIRITMLDPDATVAPHMAFEFDKASRLTAVTWQQMFNDMNSATDVFHELERLVRHRMPFPAREFRGVGTAGRPSSQSYSWAATEHQQIHLQMVQPRPRMRGREVSLRHWLEQPQATIAASPGLWAASDA